MERRVSIASVAGVERASLHGALSRGSVPSAAVSLVAGDRRRRKEERGVH